MESNTFYDIYLEELKNLPQGTPEEVAQAMVYLAGAGFVTGQNLPVNGGFVL